MRSPSGIAALVVAAVACGGGGSAAPADPDVFVAFADNLAGYRGWASFPVPTSPDPEGVPGAGTRIEYLSAPPSHGASSFPVGTVIVKEIRAVAAADARTFAMVKRGGGFNASGALGWEWFELLASAEPAVIVWRGVGPPAGELYGGDAQGGCNGCHGAAAANDFVLSSALSLRSF